MWHKNFLFVGAMLELLSNISYVLHKMHCHLILDPESAFYDHFRGSDRMQIQDPGSRGYGCGFYSKLRFVYKSSHIS